MAGIAVPTFVLLFIMTGFTFLRYVWQVPVPIERVIVFPMAVVPNLFGLWNIIFVALHNHKWLPIGMHGALLPFLLAPAGGLFGNLLGVLTFGHGHMTWFQMVDVPYQFFAIGFCCAMIGYYLVWKYLVGFFNQVLGVA
jgi:hypothetical protein